MRSRSASGNSIPTSRPISARRLRFALLVVVLTPLAAIYVIEAFIAPNPLLRIAMRTVPVLPLAVWTLWFDSSRPFERLPSPFRTIGRVGLLLIAMAFAIALLGIGLNWLYDPRRVV